ncbi:MAG: aminotransferase class III-fold pyridoxal phosphate-dependent enzyme, partial [Sulfurimonas sp.]
VMTTLKEVFSAGDHGSTFGGNFLSTTAACEVMDILGEMDESRELQQGIDYFDSELEKFYVAHKDIFTSKVGIGMMCGLRVRDADTLSKIISNAREEGVIVLRAGRDTLRLLPALTITKGEMDEGFNALNRAASSL